MATRVFMPKAGMAMEEGVIVLWFNKEGDKIKIGEPMLEIETDKVNMEIEAPATGILIKIVRQEGETVPVTETIAWIGEPGEIIEENEALEVDVSSSKNKTEKRVVSKQEASAAIVLQPEGVKIAATPLARRLAAEKGVDLRTIAASGSSGEVRARDIETIKSISATPLARKIAMDLSIDLASLNGSGFGGKIKEADVLTANAVVVPENYPSQMTDKAVRKPMSGMRKVIGKRMLESHLTIPPVTQLAKADVTELLDARKKMNAVLDAKISLNDILLKVTAIALKAYPAINVSIDGDQLIYHPVINIGMAVALEDGLIVPVIRNADQLSLLQISTLAKELSQKAHNGKLMPDDYTGGTFTVSNMGAYGIYSFTPIINPPESGILGVCTIEEQLTLNNQDVVVRKIMGFSLTYDHRVIDGAQGAIFQKKIKTLLENPSVLMAY